MRSRSIVILSVTLLVNGVGCSSLGSSSAKAPAQCQKAIDVEEQASREDVTPALDAALGRLQDAILKACGSTADFTAAWRSEGNSAFNGETKDQSAHEVLAAYCEDPVDASLVSA